MAKKYQETTLSDPADQVLTPAFAVAAAVLGIVAAWFAAGAAGFLVRPLENVLAVSAMLGAIVAAWPSGVGRVRKRWIVVGAGVFALLLLAAGGQVPAICAVALVLAALAAGNEGAAAKVVLLSAVTVTVLAVFCLSCDAIPVVWLGADILGRGLGNLGALITGQPLWIGATFAGVDLLVVMAVLYVLWLAATEPPRLRRALWGLGAIVVAQCVYLTALAFAGRLADALPQAAAANLTDINHVGTWQLADFLRAALPWNLPLLAVALLAAVAAGMLRFGRWRVPARAAGPADRAAGQGGPLLAAGAIAALLPLAVVYSSEKCDLKGKTVAAYEYGYLGWQRPETGRADPPPRSYGMLPMFVERLGGDFFRSLNLSEDDLKKADVLVVIHPNKDWPDDMKTRVLNFVRNGGSLLLAAEPFLRDGDSQSNFGQLLDGTSIRVRYDTCMAAADRWEGCYGEMANPVSIGIDGDRNRYGILLASSLAVRWPAAPVTAARFGHGEPGSDANATNVGRYEPGKKLGDLVLAAEQPYGKGRIFVLGDTGPLSNDALPASYEYVGRILSRLAHPSSQGPQVWWRELLGMLLAAMLAVSLLWHGQPQRTALVAGVLALAFLAAKTASREAGAVLPDGRGQKPNDIAYIDASHLNAYSQDAWSGKGMGNLCRVLCRAGYLPLMLDALTSERLERAGVLVSAAPQRPFTGDELRVVGKFVDSGGLLVACCGAEEAAGSRSLLEAFDFAVAPSPIPPGDPTKEPAPLGNFRVAFGDFAKEKPEEKPEVCFYAAWPVERLSGASPLVAVQKGDGARDVVVHRTKGEGDVVLIADSLFAVNDNLSGNGLKPSDNERFWRWLLGEGLDRSLPKRGMPQSSVVPEPDALLEPETLLEGDATKGGR